MGGVDGLAKTAVAAGNTKCLALNGGCSAMAQEWPSPTQTTCCCASIIRAAVQQQQCQQQPGGRALAVMAFDPAAIRAAGWSVGPTRG